MNRAPLVTLDDLQTARRRISARLHRTPTFSSASIGALTGCTLWLKAELLQKTGSFKPRGVLNTLAPRAPDELARGLITLSAGNHGAAVAWAAGVYGTRAIVVMPAAAVGSKVSAVRAYGGEPVLTDGDLLETCESLRAERGLALVHPFDDPLVIAGQGTVGLELLEEVPQADVVVVPVGGGGLISGVAAAVKRLRPQTCIIGVEPEGADVMSRSLAQGRPAHLDRPRSVADGLAAPFAGKHTFEHVRALVDQVVLVDDDAILGAMRLLLERAKLVAEPAGAAGVAALLAGAVPQARGARVICVVSGGNVDPGVLRRVLP